MKPPTEQQNGLFEAISQAANVVATFTGIKAQFVDAGWDPVNAELMVIEILRSANKEKTP